MIWDIDLLSCSCNSDYDYDNEDYEDDNGHLVTAYCTPPSTPRPRDHTHVTSARFSGFWIPPPLSTQFPIRCWCAVSNSCNLTYFIYRVTIQVVLNLPLKPKQKFCFSMRPMYKNKNFVFISMGGFAQLIWLPCIVAPLQCGRHMCVLPKGLRHQQRQLAARFHAEQEGLGLQVSLHVEPGLRSGRQFNHGVISHCWTSCGVLGNSLWRRFCKNFSEGSTVVQGGAGGCGPRFVDFDLIVPPRCPPAVCTANSAKLPSAKAQLGRSWNDLNQIQPNPVQAHHPHPVLSPGYLVPWV